MPNSQYNNRGRRNTLNSTDGIYNDAPNAVPDVIHDGVCDESDLAALGAASEIKVVNFFIR